MLEISSSQVSVMTILIFCEDNFKCFPEMDEVTKLKKPFSSILSALQNAVKMHLGCYSLHLKFQILLGPVGGRKRYWQCTKAWETCPVL